MGERGIMRSIVGAGLILRLGTAAAAAQCPRVGVYLKFEKPVFDKAARTLGKAVEQIFAPAGVELHWQLLDGRQPPGEFDRAVVIEMRGSCTPWRQQEPPAGSERLTLGWTRIEDGAVIPFCMVDCDAIARSLARPSSMTGGAAGAYTRYWQLAARVLAHELMHALLRSAEHYSSDCLRSPLRAVDLASPARLKPAETAALRRIGLAAPPILAGKPEDKRPAGAQ